MIIGHVVLFMVLVLVLVLGGRGIATLPSTFRGLQDGVETVCGNLAHRLGFAAIHRDPANRIPEMLHDYSAA